MNLPVGERPQVFVGDTRKLTMVARLQELGWGRMYADRVPMSRDEVLWAFDNGAFPAWTSGKPFPTKRFQMRIDKALQRATTPYLAVAPDIVGGGLKSLEFSLSWLDKLPKEWPWYLAVQDGMTPQDVEPHLHLFAGVFLGETNRFKFQAAMWARFAHQHGKPFHYGRAGVIGRIRNAFMAKADSFDSAFPLWTEERFDQFVELWQRLSYDNPFARKRRKAG